MLPSPLTPLYKYERDAIYPPFSALKRLPKCKSPNCLNVPSLGNLLSKILRHCQIFAPAVTMLGLSSLIPSQIRFLFQSLTEANADSVLRELCQVP